MTTATMLALPSTAVDAWNSVLVECIQHDIYHLPGYHRLAELRDEGEARLLVYCEDPYTIALPLLIRPLDDLPDLAGRGIGWYDATSVYGYAGPITSHQALPGAVIGRFQSALQEYLVEQRIVTLFTRCHTLIDQCQIMRGLGEQVVLGPTVSIPPNSDEQALFLQYRANHRLHIQRLRRQDVRCVWDSDGVLIDQFIWLYYETMDRVGATEEYYFDRAYFETFRELVPNAFHLLLIFRENEPICGGVFTRCAGIVQYHLGATATAHLKHSPMKLLMHEAAIWAAANHAHTLHLGGGVGAREDALFHFKVGFSNIRHTYRVWRWVLLPELYQTLVQTQSDRLAARGLQRATETFYPLYRAAVIPSEPGTSGLPA